MTTEQYQIGYEAGYSEGFNAGAAAIEALQGDLAVEIELRGKAERGLVDWCVKHMNLEAERDALQAENERLKEERDTNATDWVDERDKLQGECAEHKENAIRNARQAVAFRAERDALQAKLDELQRQEPQSQGGTP